MFTVYLNQHDMQNISIMFARAKYDGIEEAQVGVALAAKFQKAVNDQAQATRQAEIEAAVAQRVEKN